MIPKTYNDRLHDVQAALRRMSNTVQALQTADPSRYAGNMESLSLDAAYQAEALACQMRHIIYREVGIPRQQYLEGALPAAGIAVRTTADSVSLSFPMLMPNRKRNATREYMAGLTYAALNQAAQLEHLPRFEHCILCVVHCFEPTAQPRAAPDYDNIELKTVQDLLALFLMVDDSMRYCDRIETTRPDAVSHTEFHVIRQGAFCDWLKAEKEGGKQYPILEEIFCQKSDTALCPTQR